MIDFLTELAESSKPKVADKPDPGIAAVMVWLREYSPKIKEEVRKLNREHRRRC